MKMATALFSFYEGKSSPQRPPAKRTFESRSHRSRCQPSRPPYSTPFSAVSITTAILLYSAGFATGQGQNGNQLSYRLLEEREAGAFIGNIARDAEIYRDYSQDQFEKLEYRIPDKLNKFVIDKKTSNLRTAQVIDRETECPPGSLQPGELCAVSFDASVFSTNDDGGFDLLQIIKVTINIQDINDNPPRFPSNVTVLDIPESVEAGEVLHTSAASDSDASPNNTVKEYRLLGGADIFELQDAGTQGASSSSLAGTSSDLGIVLKRKLDREKVSSYSLAIVAIDGGVNPRTGSVNITINVLDANDNRPAFDYPTFTADVPENAPAGSTVLSLAASDSDAEQNGRIVFSFSTPTPVKVSEYFAINASSGDIYLVKNLDYEKDPRFAFSVTVTDGGTPAKSSEASVQISVQDINDNAPQIQVTLPKATVRENMKVNSYIAHLSPSDRDSDANSDISCSVVNNEHFALQKFSETQSIFKVILNQRLDYERSRTEIVNVTCVDSGTPPLSNSTAFTLQILDVNDNSPVFERPEYGAHIAEGNHIGEFVTQIQAKDPDDDENGNVTYALIENPEGRFSINPLSGVIKAVEELDRETTAIYKLIVQARDRGDPSLSATVLVTVAVDDINDNPPTFPVPVMEMRVMENRPQNSVVGTVRAKDPDTGPNTDNRLRYSIKDNFEFPHLFALDRLSGVLYTKGPLDREERASYLIGVEVKDDTQPNFKAEAQVSVLVADDNDHPPSFRFPGAVGRDNSTVVVSFDRPAGSIIMTMAWEDEDSGENATVTFSIAKGDDAKLFFLHAVTGELMIARRMDARDIGVHTLVVVARDGGVSFLETRHDLHVEVTSANGTLGFIDDDDSSSANIAIVIALVCITAVLALAVLVTICIIRRIDRERKQHNSAKMEEENIYKQQHRHHHKSPSSSPPGGPPSSTTVNMGGSGLGFKQAATSPGIPASPSHNCSTGRDNDKNFETELDKLRRKVKQDLSFGVEDDTNPLDASQSLSTKSASSFSTFKNNSSSSAGVLSPEKKSSATTQSHSSVLQNTLSPTEGHVKRVHYMDKGLDIDRLTCKSPPPRSQPGVAPTSSPRGFHAGGYSSPRGGPWTGSGRGQHRPEDAASHSSGSTSDSGRGGSSEEGDGQGHLGHSHNAKQHAVVVTLGDGDGASTTPTTPTNTYPTTSAHLMTFMSPKRSPASSSGTSVMPRSSLSASANSETAKKRLWTDSNATPSTTNNNTPTTSNVTTPTNLSSKLSSDSPLYPVGFPEISSAGAIAAAGNVFRPNISFSDDSVTANASIGAGPKFVNGSNSAKNRANSYNNAIKTSPRGGNYGQHGGSTPSIYPASGVPKSPDTLNPVPLPTATKSVPATPAAAFTSTRRPQKPESESSDTPYRLMAANLSRIPADPEVSTRHGTFLEGPSTSLVDASGSSRPSRSYANASRANKSNDNVFSASPAGIHGGVAKRGDRAPNYSNPSHINNNRNSFHADVRNNNNNNNNNASFVAANTTNNNLSQSRLGGSLRADNSGYFGQRPHAVSGQHRPNLSTIEQSSASSSAGGEPYSLSDMKAVLDAASTVDKPRDDDNTTTTSGSYTINADDLCQEIDHLFFKDIVV